MMLKTTERRSIISDKYVGAKTQRAFKNISWPTTTKVMKATS